MADTSSIEYKKKARHGHGKDVVDANDIRQVAGCLPIDHTNKRFLLISSRKIEDAWVIPKGGWEEDETQEHAALRETWEEAGIKGTITAHLGVFAETGKKKVKAHHWIYEMSIQEVAKKFPEKKKRERRWFSYEEALMATRAHPFMQEAIQRSSLAPQDGLAVSTPPQAPQAAVTPPVVPENEQEGGLSRLKKKLFG
ncbi:NUDIX hydrolase domain-like protein [Spinellus fusiger]|nr:NUDIX hydrolase domain-like protein [Spinellus fusiger]